MYLLSCISTATALFFPWIRMRIGKYIIVTYSCICFLLVSWLWSTSKLQDWEPGSSTEERVSRKCESDDNFCCWRLCSAPLASANSNFPFPSSPAYTCFLFSLSQPHKEASKQERYIPTELLNTDAVMTDCGGVRMIKVTMASLSLCSWSFTWYKTAKLEGKGCTGTSRLLYIMLAFFRAF